MKKVYDIYKHTKGLPYYIDICLADEEECFIFENEYEAKECCKDMNERNKNCNYYYRSRNESDNYICY